jgi:lipid-binding SYLF domain-containing protein
VKLHKLIFSALLGATAFGAAKHAQRLEDAATVLEEVMSLPEKAIPQNLLDKAHCVAIVPDLKKGAFIFGAHYGKGYITCRNSDGEGWSAPATIRVEGGSFGLQLGATETDVIMLVMNSRGADKLMSSKFTLGGSAQAAAGPVGRTAAADTDALMHAEILSYSRARGVFAGVSLQGATLREDLNANKALYQHRLTTSEIVRDPKIKPTHGGEQLIALLTMLSPRESR